MAKACQFIDALGAVPQADPCRNDALALLRLVSEGVHEV
jgi:hypothetical protein